MQIKIYTDGACVGNPGPGGWAAIILLENEKKSLKILCQGAAIRFLLTRVFDYLNLTEGAIVKIKDPVEYLKRLEFHDSVNSYEDYFF